MGTAGACGAAACGALACKCACWAQECSWGSLNVELELGRERLWWLSLEAGGSAGRWVERLQAPWPPPVDTLPPRCACSGARCAAGGRCLCCPPQVWGLFRLPTIRHESLQLPCRCSHRLGACGLKGCAPVCRLVGAPGCGGSQPHLLYCWALSWVVACWRALMSLGAALARSPCSNHGSMGGNTDAAAAGLPCGQVLPFGRAVFQPAVCSSQCAGHSFARTWHLNLGGLSAQVASTVRSAACSFIMCSVIRVLSQCRSRAPLPHLPCQLTGAGTQTRQVPGTPCKRKRGLLYRQLQTRLDMRECSSNGGLQLPHSRQIAARRW